ncbi:MAG: phage antirepressor KilAC domain-containing protein [Pseudomonadota bacterium]
MNTDIITMSSREIADLLEKRHDKVKQSIERLVEKGIIEKPPLDDEHESTTTPTGGRRKYTTSVYHLGKRDTFVVVAQLSPEFTARVVDRWQELEAQVARPAKPAMLSGPQLMAAALIEADATMKEQARQIEGMREDVEAHQRLTKAEGSLNITDAAKTLGMRPIDLFQWLSQNGWIYKRPHGATWLGYQTKCNQGLLEHKTTTVLRADGSEKITEQVRVSPKGLSSLAKLIQPTARLIA